MRRLLAPSSRAPLSLLAAGLALAIAMVVLGVVEYVRERDAMRATLDAQASVVGESSIPALLFDDAGAAHANLVSIASASTMRAVALYRVREPGGDPQLFAVHRQPGAHALFSGTGLHEQRLAEIVVVRPLLVESEIIGFVQLIGNPRVLFVRVSRYMLTVLVVASGALVLAYVLTAGLRRRVADTEHMLQRRAYFDELTELPNRSLFNERMEQAVALSRRSATPLALLFCDLDNFKVINDSLGHAEGDRLLQFVARRMQEAIRAADTVCRLGGDEFVVILEGSDASAAAHVAEHLIDALQAPYHGEHRVLSIGTSIGIAMYPADGADAGELLRAADTALYAAKSDGRNAYRFFSRSLDQQAHERMALENGLRRALGNGELYLHYQPQVDLECGTVLGAEALLRWRSPEFGEVAPDRFIPVAEESGLIGEIGNWVLDEACRQAGVWMACAPGFAMAVNVSARQLNSPQLIENLRACLSRHGIPGGQLELEITESALLGGSEQVVETLKAIEAVGVALSLDDFGTGYSSLSYLKRLPIGRLKIDRGFVRDLPDDPEDAAIVDAVLALGKALGITVVAEGIETEAQSQYLRAAGCSHGQGYLYGRPMPAAAFEIAHLDAIALAKAQRAAS